MFNTQEQVTKIVSELLKIDLIKITKDSHFINDLGGDSLDAVEIALAIEDAFNIIVPDNQAGKLITVGQLVDFIEANKN
jgi:acyl carrier protein